MSHSDDEEIVDVKYIKMVETEKNRIKKLKESRNKARPIYEDCSKCKKKKHFTDFYPVLNNGKKILLTEDGVLKKDEDGNSVYLPQSTCKECIIYVRNYLHENKEFLKSKKQSNEIICKCGGKYDSSSKYYKNRHELSKQHQSWEINRKYSYANMKKTELLEICKINHIFNMYNCKKDEIFNKIKVLDDSLTKQGKKLLLIEKMH